jgi:Cell division protein
MTTPSRTTRTRKEKNSFAFGHLVLPLAAIVAIGLLFAGVKLFFLTPPGGEGRMESAASEATLPENGAMRGSPAEGDRVAGMVGGSQDGAVPVRDAGGTASGVSLAGPVTDDGTSGGPAVATAQEKKLPPAGAIANNTPAKSASSSKKASAGVKKAPSGAGANTKWAVQIGAFIKPEGAETVRKKAAQKGYDVDVSTATSSGQTFHRVRVEPGGASRAEAEKLAQELEKNGFSIAIVPVR